MKKILTLLLSVAMIMTCTPTVFAGENAVVPSDTKAVTTSTENQDEEKTSNESSEKESNLQEEEADLTTLSKEEEEPELTVTGTDYVAKITDTLTEYETAQAAINAATSGQTVQMIADSKENVSIARNKEITLDLNGHVLKGTGSGSVIYINGESETGKHDAKNKLTIIDTNTNAKHYFRYSSAGAWTLDDTASSGIAISEITSSTKEKAVIEVNGGVITGANNSGNGGGISVGISSELVMTGGTICGNTANQGGGLYTGNTVQVTLRDTTIVGNQATTQFGGAVLNAHDSTFTFGGVVRIFGNAARNYNNLTLWDAVSGAPITIDENNKLADGSKILVQFGYQPSTGVGAFTTNGTATDANYFTSDSLTHKVKFVEATTTVAAHLELADYDINAVALDTASITLEKDAMTEEQAIAIAKAQKSSLTKETVIAYAKAENFDTDKKYKTIKADSGTEWSARDDMTLAEMKVALLSEDVFVIGTADKHVHKWTYAAYKSEETLKFDDTITAECKGNGTCDYTGEDKTLTISASNATYNGGTYGATLSGTTIAGISKPNMPAIKYAKKTGENTYGTETTDVPKAAGVYKASITIGSGDSAKTASVEYTISPKQLTVIGTTADEKIYDGKTVAVAHIGTVSGKIGTDDVKVEIDSANFEDKNVGNCKTVTVSYKLSGGDAGNYTEPIDSTTSADITPKAVTVTADDKSMTLGSNVPEFTATIDGVVAGEESKIIYKFKEIEKPEAQGVYSIVPYVKEEPKNYSVTCKQGKLTVTKADSKAKANSEDLSKVLDKYRDKEEYKGKTLDVEVKTDGEVPQSDKTLITQKAGTNKKIDFYDTDLLLISKDESGTKTKDIGDENETLIGVTYKFDFSNKKDIQVFRAHTNSQQQTSVDELTATPNTNEEYVEFNKTAGTITVHAKKYSTYAFAYNEAKGNGGNKSSSDNGTGTGDSINLTAVVILLLLAIGGAVAALLVRRRNN